MTGPMMRRRAPHRTCQIHGDNGCEIRGEAGFVERPLENRRWRREVAAELVDEADRRGLTDKAAVFYTA
jgi:hypothetical protein